MGAGPQQVESGSSSQSAQDTPTHVTISSTETVIYKLLPLRMPEDLELYKKLRLQESDTYISDSEPVYLAFQMSTPVTGNTLLESDQSLVTLNREGAPIHWYFKTSKRLKLGN